MSRNRRVFGVRVAWFIAGMCMGGFLAGFKMQDIPAGQETGKTWERQEQSPADSTLDHPAECYLCGNHNRSLMSMFRGRDDLGVICVNDWYVMDMQIRNLDGTGWAEAVPAGPLVQRKPAVFRRTGIRNGEFQRLQ